jgi:hypothetical protein
MKSTVPQLDISYFPDFLHVHLHLYPFLSNTVKNLIHEEPIFVVFVVQPIHKF